MKTRSTIVALWISVCSVRALPQAQTPTEPTADMDDPSTEHLAMSLATLSNPKGSSPQLARLSTLLPKVLENAIATSHKSWELGALTQALLEVYDPQFTPFEWDITAIEGRRPVPWRVVEITNNSLSAYNWSGSPGEVNGWYDKRAEGGGHTWLREYLDPTKARIPLVDRALVPGDGALGDPCSLGPAVWLLAQLADRRGEVRRAGIKDAQDYAWAVGSQLQYLNKGVRTDNGTISMREAYFAAWSDMGYMIPPFLAYLGMSSERPELLNAALAQFAGESASLLDKPTNLYRHITALDKQNSWDPKIWATGNGWMTYGLVRVLASVKSTKTKEDFSSQVEPLHQELVNVFDALFAELDHENLIPNYMKPDEANVTLSRGDSAGTALIVAAFYRFAVLAPNKVTVLQKEKAETAFNGVLERLDDAGWLRQVVDPMGTNGWIVIDGMKSPEGQSFVGMMWAARVAYEHCPDKGSSG